MTNDISILNNFTCTGINNINSALGTLQYDANRYDETVKQFKLDLDIIECLIDSPTKGDASTFKANAAKILIRYAEALARDRNHSAAYEVLTALEGATGFTIKDTKVENLARRLGIDTTFLQKICKKSNDDKNGFDFPYAKYLSLKADALKGLKKYSEAISLYKQALSQDTAGRWSDCAPYAKVGLLEAEIATGKVTSENIQARTEEEKKFISSRSLSPREKQALFNRLDKLFKFVKKDFETLIKEDEAKINDPDLSPADKAQARKDKAWHLLNLANFKAFGKPEIKKNDDPKLICTADTCPVVEGILDKIDVKLSDEIKKSVIETKILFLLKWANRLIKAKDINTALEKAKAADALIDRKELKTIAWLAWTYIDIARAGEKEALTKALALVEDEVGADQIDKNSMPDKKTGKKGGIRNGVADAMMGLAKKYHDTALLDKAIGYCKKYGFGELYIKGLWIRINAKKNNEKAIEGVIGDLKTLAAIYSSKSGRLLPEKLALSSAPKLTFDGKIKYYTIGIVLDNISDLLKKHGEKENAKLFHDAAIGEYKHYQPIFEDLVIRKPTFENFSTLAQIYAAIGRSYLNEKESKSDVKIKGQNYLNFAGFIYNKLLGIHDFVFDAPALRQDIKIKLLASFGKTKEEARFKHLHEFSNYALIALEIKLRGIKVSGDNAKQVGDDCITILSAIERALEKETEEGLIAALENGKIEVIRIWSTALIRLGRSNEIIKFLKENIASSLSRKNYPEALGNIKILAWAYSEGKQYNEVFALYYALLNGANTNKAPALNNILDLIIKNRENLLSAEALKGAGLSMEKLKNSFTLLMAEMFANDLKVKITAAKDKKDKAIIYRDALALFDKPSIFEELKVLNFMNLEKMVKEIAEIKSDDPEVLKSSFQAYQLLAWLHSLKGFLIEKVKGGGKGSIEYAKAAKMGEKLLEFSADIIADFKTQDDTPLTRTDIYLLVAGLYQTASKGNEKYLEDALKAFNSAIKEIGDPKDALGKLALTKAYIGKAQVLSSQENAEETKEAYEKALSMIDPKDKKMIPYLLTATLGKTEAILALAQKGKDNTKMEAAAAEAKHDLETIFELVKDSTSENKYKFTNALLWALSTLSDAKGKNTPELTMLIALYRALLKGKDDTSITGFYGGALKFVLENRKSLLDEDMLKEFDASKLILRMRYIGALLSAELYDEGFKEFQAIEGLLKANDGKETLKNEALEIANLLARMAEVSCYNLGLLDKAEELFKRAFDRAPKTDTGSLSRIYRGLAFIYEKKGDSDKALKNLDNALALSGTSIKAFSVDYKGELAKLKDKKDVALIQTLLTIGNIYNYNSDINDAKELIADDENAKEHRRRMALSFYKVAGLLARGLDDKYLRRRLMAKACHGVAETYRLFDKEEGYDEARKFYELGIELLDKSGKIFKDDKDDTDESDESRRDSKKVLGQLFGGLATNYAMQKQFDIANAKIGEATAALASTRVIDEQFKDFKDKKAAILNALIRAEYIDKAGNIQKKFYDAKKEGFKLDATVEAGDLDKIYDILKGTIDSEKEAGGAIRKSDILAEIKKSAVSDAEAEKVKDLLRDLDEDYFVFKPTTKKIDIEKLEIPDSLKGILLDAYRKSDIDAVKNLEETTRNIKRRQIDKLTTVQFGFTRLSEDYKSGSTHSHKTGWTPFVRSIINIITNAFDLRVNYIGSLGKEFPRILADKKKRQSGLNVNRQHTVSADVDWHPDYSVLKRIRVGAESTTATYSIAENPGQYNRSINNAAFQSLTLRAEGEFAGKPLAKSAPWLTLSFQPRIAVLASSTTSPLIENAKQIQKEILENDPTSKVRIETGRKPDDSERVSITGVLSANIDVPGLFGLPRFNLFGKPLLLSTRVGVGGGYDPLRYFGNGFWPVNGNEPLYSLYPFLNVRGEYELGSRNSFLFEFYLQRTAPGLSQQAFRTELYGNAKAGWRHYFDNGQSFEVNLEGSKFKAEKPAANEHIDNNSGSINGVYRF
ncbi:tetratricopeptide repeat protein [Candidatus Saganbacteria bacterium]|nr:tetratricopeptide repeat protein [Candidatus Saganbacteria bacterium]